VHLQRRPLPKLSARRAVTRTSAHRLDPDTRHRRGARTVTAASDRGRSGCLGCGHRVRRTGPVIGGLPVLRAAIMVLVGDVETVTLWRPTGPQELALVERSGWRAWPPRLADQPIFYPVLNEEYATMIARDWNVPASGAGYVTRFEVRRSFLDTYEVHQVGGRTILEYWIPAEDLDELNANIIGTIDVVAEYR
jgi:hypothetical protein